MSTYGIKTITFYVNNNVTLAEVVTNLLFVHPEVIAAGEKDSHWIFIEGAANRFTLIVCMSFSTSLRDLMIIMNRIIVPITMKPTWDLAKR